MGTKPRVLHIVTKMVVCGGASRTAEVMARYQHGSHSAYDGGIAFGRADDGEDELAVGSEVPQFAIPDLVREISPRRDLRALRQIRAVLRDFGPSVLHTHSSKAGVLGRLAARAEGVPVVVHHVQGWSFHDGMPWAKRFAFITIERHLARRCDALLSDSTIDMVTAERLGIGRAGRRHTVRPGIELSGYEVATQESRRAARALLGLSEDAFVVGTVAQMRPQKAPLDFVKVARRLVDRIEGVQFVWVGDGAMRGEVAAALAAAGLTERFLLTGSRLDVGRLYPAFDVFLLTSLWEGCPRTVAEAGISGVPVVATAVPGTAESVVHGESGLLAPPGDVDGLAQCVVELWQSPELRERLRHKAAADLREEWSIERVMGNLESLYTELLASKSSRSRR